jgi:transposase
MEFKWIVGVDMSKNWFNYCLMNASTLKIEQQGQVDNTPEAIADFLDILQQDFGVCLAQVALVMEHTGIYTMHLAHAWFSAQGRLSVVPASKVSNLLGGQHGWSEKTDALDAQRLAEYGARYTDKLEWWQPQDKTLQLLQALQRQRQRALKDLNILAIPVQEAKDFLPAEHVQQLVDNQRPVIEALKQLLKKVEQQMSELIQNDEQLKKLFKLITSVPGVGAITAQEILIATAAFTSFSPNQAKAFAKYAGVVPIECSSGKHRRRPRVPKRANKKIKELLTMCAVSLLKTKGELAQYYHRKIAQGKHHRQVINAMRNKLILRIFAVVRNQTMYQKNLNLCLD